jgi:hypothetical protein
MMQLVIGPLHPYSPPPTSAVLSVIVQLLIGPRQPYSPPPFNWAELPVIVQLASAARLGTEQRIAPPWSAEFSLNVQLSSIGLLSLLLYIPPAQCRAELRVNSQLVTNGLLSKLHMPPPYEDAEFSLNVQLCSVGLVNDKSYTPPKLYTPPPNLAELPLKFESVTVGLLWSLYIAPPFFAEFPPNVQLTNVGPW